MKNLKKVLSIVVLLLTTVSWSQDTVYQKNLKVKDTVHITPLTYSTKSPVFKNITIQKGAVLYISTVVVVENILWAESSKINIKFKGKGCILVRGGKTNLKNSRVVVTEKESTFKGFKDNDHLKVWTLDGKLVVSDKYYNIEFKKFKSNYYDVQVKGKGFRSDYFLGTRKNL